ncbi:MAG: hypothetical protein GY765_35420 [bacterium]|nr:hypothetical protein [bacterium]
MSFENDSLQVKVAKASQMVAGLKRNIESLSPAGVKPEYIASAEGLLKKMKRTYRFENQKEAADYQRMICKMTEMYCYFRKIVTVIIPGKDWRQFGLDRSDSAA